MESRGETGRLDPAGATWRQGPAAWQDATPLPFWSLPLCHAAQSVGHTEISAPRSCLGSKTVGALLSEAVALRALATARKPSSVHVQPWTPTAGTMLASWLGAAQPARLLLCPRGQPATAARRSSALHLGPAGGFRRRRAGAPVPTPAPTAMLSPVRSSDVARIVVAGLGSYIRRHKAQLRCASITDRVHNEPPASPPRPNRRQLASPHPLCSLLGAGVAAVVALLPQPNFSTVQDVASQVHTVRLPPLARHRSSQQALSQPVSPCCAGGAAPCRRGCGGLGRLPGGQQCAVRGGLRGAVLHHCQVQVLPPRAAAAAAPCTAKVYCACCWADFLQTTRRFLLLPRHAGT